MSVSAKSTVKQTSKTKKKRTSLQRRQNQKAEIDELASHFQLSTPVAEESTCDNKTSSAIDRLSVLRLTTSFLKFQNFLKDISPSNGGHVSPKKQLLGLMEEAIDGFLIVLDKEANVLYVSETIVDCVGLRQQDVIGQNLVDITHSSCANEITDNLKPSVTLSSSAVENCVISQLRQFHLMFKSTAASSRNNSYMIVQVHGNLKVKMPPLKNTCSGNRQMEMVEPSVIGFVGICELVESAASADEIFIPRTTFSWTCCIDTNKIVSVEGLVKEVIGYNPDVFQADNASGIDFVHPDDVRLMPVEKVMKFLSKAEYVVIPHFRVLTSSGAWIWMQAEVTLRYKCGTTVPELCDLRCRAIRQGKGKLQYITQQRECCASVPNPGQDPLNPYTYSALVIPRPISTPIASHTDGDEPLSIMVSQSSSIITHNGSSSMNTIDPTYQLPSHSQQQSDTQPLAATAQANCFHVGSSAHDHNSIPPPSWTCSSTALSFTQQPQREPLNGIVSSPSLTGSSDDGSSSPSSSIITPTAPQQDFEFQNHINQLEMCPPSNSDVNSPPNTFSSLEMGITLHASLNTDSSTTYSLYQNTHQINPHGSYDFNPHIPSSFNFSTDTTPYYPPNNCPSSAFIPYLSSSLPETQDTSNSIIYPVSQAQNDASTSFGVVAPMLNWSSNMDLAPLYFQCTRSSNREIQDTVQ